MESVQSEKALFEVLKEGKIGTVGINLEVE